MLRGPWVAPCCPLGSWLQSSRVARPLRPQAGSGPNPLSQQQCQPLSRQQRLSRPIGPQGPTHPRCLAVVRCSCTMQLYLNRSTAETRPAANSELTVSFYTGLYPVGVTCDSQLSCMLPITRSHADGPLWTQPPRLLHCTTLLVEHVLGPELRALAGCATSRSLLPCTAIPSWYHWTLCSPSRRPSPPSSHGTDARPRLPPGST